jgi:hypothetical protein
VGSEGCSRDGQAQAKADPVAPPPLAERLEGIGGSTRERKKAFIAVLRLELREPLQGLVPQCCRFVGNPHLALAFQVWNAAVK